MDPIHSPLKKAFVAKVPYFELRVSPRNGQIPAIADRKISQDQHPLLVKHTNMSYKSARECLLYPRFYLTSLSGSYSESNCIAWRIIKCVQFVSAFSQSVSIAGLIFAYQLELPLQQLS